MNSKINKIVVGSLVAPPAIAVVLSGAGSANAATGDCDVRAQGFVTCSEVATPTKFADPFNKGLGANGQQSRFAELQDGVFKKAHTWLELKWAANGGKKN